MRHLSPHFSSSPPLSLYLHIPWCVRKCPYCDFNSHTATETLPEKQYIDALLRDLEQELPQVWGRTVQTVFIGGGTPSLFQPESIDRLLCAIQARLPLRPRAEITLEANPGSVDQGRFHEFRAAGINRLSIGVQSFDDRLLNAIGRIHDGRAAIAAVQAAQDCGFEHLNLDLMFGLPGQDPKQADQDIQTALSLDPGHLSCYQLTLEPNTPFHRHPPTLPPDELRWAMQQQHQHRLATAGYTQYEVSAYARPGQQARHNLNYWEFGDYLGIGAGAHGKRTDPAAQRVERQRKRRHPKDYLSHALDGDAVAERWQPDGDELILEFLMNALRLRQGVPARRFTERTGLDLSQIAGARQTLVEQGLLEADPQRLQASEQGYRFLDEVLQRFLPDHAAAT